LFMRDIITGLVKSIVFGLVITGVGCQEGFSTRTGSEQVGRSTTAAVVTSIFLIVFVDLVFTAIFYVTGGAGCRRTRARSFLPETYEFSTVIARFCTASTLRLRPARPW